MPLWNLRQTNNNLYIPVNDLIVLITAKKDTNDGCQRTKSLIDFFPFSISLTCRTISIENRVYRLYDRIIVGYINEKKKMSNFHFCYVFSVQKQGADIYRSRKQLLDLFLVSSVRLI